MHIIIGFITAVAGLLWALNSLQRGGIDIGWLNPFTWNRRRKWRQKYQKVPLYNLHNSMEAAAVIIIGTLKQKGELTTQRRQFAISTFERTFNLSETEAANLFTSSTFLLRNVEMDIDIHIADILEQLKNEFSTAQINSLYELVGKAAEQEGSPTEAQERTINSLRQVFNRQRTENNW